MKPTAVGLHKRLATNFFRLSNPSESDQERCTFVRCAAVMPNSRLLSILTAALCVCVTSTANSSCLDISESHYRSAVRLSTRSAGEPGIASGFCRSPLISYNVRTLSQGNRVTGGALESISKLARIYCFTLSYLPGHCQKLILM